MMENRFKMLTKSKPEDAKRLFAEAQNDVDNALGAVRIPGVARLKGQRAGEEGIRRTAYGPYNNLSRDDSPHTSCAIRVTVYRRP